MADADFKVTLPLDNGALMEVTPDTAEGGFIKVQLLMGAQVVGEGKYAVADSAKFTRQLSIAHALRLSDVPQ